MRLSNAYALTLLFVAPFARTGHLHAAPDVTVSAMGGCPTRSELEQCLSARGLRLGGSHYLVATQTRTEDVVMQLIRNGTDVLLTRQFANGDCRAVAEATAVVVEAYFIEVRGWSQQPEAKPHLDVPPAPPVAGAVVAESNIGPALSEPRYPLSSPAIPRRGSAAQDAPGAAAGRSEQVARSQQQSRPRATLFAGVGPTVALPNPGPSVQFEAGGGLEFESVPLSVELQLATSVPNVSGNEPSRVRRWPSQTSVRIGTPLGSLISYRPWVGIGANFAQLRALDVPAPSSRFTATPLVGAGVELAWPITERWLGRFDSGCMTLSTRDAYRLEPDGEIGSGPRVVCAVMLGVRFGNRKRQFTDQSR